jgi:hypothetical protein
MIKRIEILGRVEYLLNDEWHCPNGPAIDTNDGKWYWYLNGEYHRYYGCVTSYGNWCIHGKWIKW